MKTKKINSTRETALPEGAITRALPCRVRMVPGKDRTLRFVASTERVARDGDIVRVAGWDTEEFMRNPVFLYGHYHYGQPHGKVTKIRKITKPKDGGEKRLEIDVEFAGLEQLHEDAERTFLLYRDGFLNAVSVGFIPTAFEDLAPEQKKEMGLGEWGRAIKSAELLEVSAVPVPADPGAVMLPPDADAGDKKALTDHLVTCRSAAPAETRDGWDALIRAVEEPPEPVEDELEEDDPPSVSRTASGADPVETALSALTDEIKKLAATVARIDSTQPDRPEADAPSRSRDDPAATVPPQAPPPSVVPETDFYGIADRALEKMKR